jgi:predicted dehydrogenase
MNRIRIGLLGAGRMGKNHARVLSTLRYADLVGIYDPNPIASDALAKQHGVMSFSCPEELLRQVDAVSIATPTPFHHALALQSLALGLDVFVEKPFTETVAQAEEVARAVESSDQILQVGHIERFNSAYREMKTVVGEMTPLAVNFQRLSTYVGSNVDVDVVLDLMVHDIDLALDLAGELPTDVQAIGMTVFSGTIDYATVALRFPTVPLMTLTASRVTEQKVRKIDISALEAFIEADLLNKSVSAHHGTIGEYVPNGRSGGKYRQESVVERIHVPVAEPLYLELEEFVSCVQQRSKPMVTARNGLETLRLAEQIRHIILPKMIDAHPNTGKNAAVQQSSIFHAHAH